MPLPPAISSARRRVRRWAVNVPNGPSAQTGVPGSISASREVCPPTAVTVSRSHSEFGAADSENGCDCHQPLRVRNRQRMNWPAWAGSLSRFLPSM